MAANRKLLSEVQQVLKKVEEGIETFDDILAKVYAAEQQSLKEKHESDLKKEIKKLQRLRDQIKAWLSSVEIKDKSQLTEARKIIETKMEQFKVCEKDTKTKAYSREGLAREARSDPKDAEKEDKRVWANDCLSRLQDIVESIEADVEKISSTSRAKSKMKDQIEKMENRIKKNKWHIAKLEQILRKMDSDELDPSLIDAIKDDLEFYLDNALEDDGALDVNDEFDIYESLQLDDQEKTDDEDTSLSGSNSDSSESNKTKKAPEPPKAGGVLRSQSLPIPSTKSLMNPNASSTTVAKNNSSIASPRTPATTAPKVDPPKPLPTAAKEVDAKPEPSSSWASLASTSQKSPALGGKNATQVPSPMLQPQTSNNSVSSTSPSFSLAASGNSASMASVVASSVSSSNTSNNNSYVSGTSSSSNSNSNVSSTTTSTMASVVGSNNNVGSSSSFLNPITSAASASSMSNATASAPFSGNTSNSSGTPMLNEVNKSSPNLVSQANSSLPSKSDGVNSSFVGAYASIWNSVRYSSQFLPESIENDRLRPSVSRSPIQTHPAFPTHPFPAMENPAFFDRLPVDTLFFAFYFQPNTYSQYLAARKLKQNSWRFHKKYMTWFQRHVEPIASTDTYEEGTYVYFDFDNGWCQRIKSEFKFEYAFLEDDLHVPSSSTSNAASVHS